MNTTRVIIRPATPTTMATTTAISILNADPQDHLYSMALAASMTSSSHPTPSVTFTNR